MTLNLDDIAPGKAQRGLIIGGSRSGKSTLVDMLIRHAVITRPSIRALVLDSKPRFRAEIQRNGKLVRDAEKNYRDWAKGPVIPGSYRFDIDAEPVSFKPYWKDDDPCRVVLAQTDDEIKRPRLLHIANEFYQAKWRDADRLLVVDELLDFYHGNAVSISPRENAPVKVNRAGGERGIGGLYGAQRPKGIHPQIVEELSILYLFHIRFQKDMNYLYEHGIPTDIVPPEENYVFEVVKIQPGGKAERVGKFRLALEQWYTSQLSAT